MSQAYLIAGYGEHTCSVCGVKYTEKEYFTYYTTSKLMKYHINCKKCGAVFSETPKRCYYLERYNKDWCPCGESIEMDGILYCGRQMTGRKKELQAWGAYYPCEAYKPPKKEPDYKQLSFFEEVQE